jgi:hypothetical protein
VISDEEGGLVTRVDPNDLASVLPVPLEGFAQVAFRDGHAWATSDRTLLEIDVATNEVLRTIDLGMPSSAIYATPDAIWITSFSWDTLIRLDL